MTLTPRQLSTRTFVRGFVGAFALRAAGAGVSLLATVVLARARGVTHFGMCAYALALVSVLGIPARLATGSVLIRFGASYGRRGGAVMIVLGRDIITVVYGKEFAGAYVPPYGAIGAASASAVSVVVFNGFTGLRLTAQPEPAAIEVEPS